MIFFDWGELAGRCVWSERKGCLFFFMDSEKIGGNLI